MKIRSLRNVKIAGVRYKREVEATSPAVVINGSTIKRSSDSLITISNWLDENCVGRYHRNLWTVKFERKDDAILFAMRFS